MCVSLKSFPWNVADVFFPFGLPNGAAAGAFQPVSPIIISEWQLLHLTVGKSTEMEVNRLGFSPSFAINQLGEGELAH